MSGEAEKKDVQAFWKALYHSLHDGVDDGQTRAGLMDALAETEDMFRLREHMAVVEMPAAEIAGKAAVMLYCKDSWHYWINMFLCVGILKGKALFDRHWLGKATEWGGRDDQAVLKPITRCYTRAGIHRLFHQFENVGLRKREFYFYLIPKLGRLYRRWQIRRYGTHPGGILVYGEPWPI
jgi:hypothetical protein